ncbi:class IV adenylate cyclase [Candidatus Peregrinibacteria bacterium]|nr:class IV adenylate cyclase [Candidatus Peregrinibacteria bacterium]
MREIEVKFLEVNPEDVISSLEDLGAKRVFDGEIVADYFDFDDKRLTKNDATIRLRTKGDIVELTLKQRKDYEQAKVCDEYEVNVSDAETMKEILKHLSLQFKRRITRHRISYLLGKTRFEIDTVPGIPPFLEIEAPTVEDIKKYAEKLGLSMKHAKPWSTTDVQKFYKKKKQ